MNGVERLMELNKEEEWMLMGRQKKKADKEEKKTEKKKEKTKEKKKGKKKERMKTKSNKEGRGGLVRPRSTNCP